MFLYWGKKKRRRRKRKKERQNSDTKARQETTRPDKRHQGKQETQRQDKTLQETQKQDKRRKSETRLLPTSYQARLHLSDFATATDVRLKWTLTLKVREDRQSTRQLGGHGGEVHSHVNECGSWWDRCCRKTFCIQSEARQDHTRQSQDKTR